MTVVVLLALFVAQGLVSRAMFPTWKEQYSSHNVAVTPGLSIDQLLASVAGLREMVAGVLWVQSDEFFHTGQFDAILPVIRLVTWLNPRQLEVYSTGAWHIGYNFTDEQNRSDRRYIPLALRLLQDGVDNNPNTYELYHDYGWMYFNKIEDDYDKAVHWFQKSVEQPDVLPALRSILASAYLKTGDRHKALDYYWFLQQDFQKRYDATKDQSLWNIKDTQENNLNNTLVRMAARGNFAREAGVYGQLPYDTKNPIDLNFTAKIEVLEPKVIRVKGTWGIPATGARIRMVIRDQDYNLAWVPAPELDFERDKPYTFMLDPLYTQDGRFDRKIDMSRNPTMYPFNSEKYYVEFYFNPRNAPPHIQDRIGWDGEGMTDKRYISETERPGVRVLMARFEMTKDQFLLRGDYSGGFVFKTPGYREIAGKYDQDIIIKQPSLRVQ